MSAPRQRSAPQRGDRWALEGLRAIAEARSSAELFSRLLGALRSPLAADMAVVLSDPDGQGRTLAVVASTDPSFAGAEITPGRTLLRALGGRVTTLADTAAIAELRAPPFDRIGSVVLLPLAGERSRALILFGSHGKQAFAPHHEHLVRRMMPLPSACGRRAERDDHAATEIQRVRARGSRPSADARSWGGGQAARARHEINTQIPSSATASSFSATHIRVRARSTVYRRRSAAADTGPRSTSLEQAEVAADLDTRRERADAFARPTGSNRVATSGRA